MDAIEEGFLAISRKIELLKEEKESFSAEIKKKDSQLLERMAEHAAPFISTIGLNLLQQGKKDGKGEIFDAAYFTEKMFVLGKTDPVPFRPDDVEKPVTSQYCVLSEKGTFLELMYSENDVLIETYLNPLSPDEVLDIYGYDIMYMLYRALHDYSEEEEELVKALGRTIEYVFELEKRE
ncbi:MAG: hypothetical protein RQ758_07865 [Methanomicrobiaceae archaeon]|nr:hypothetical protein [Methanomicrobiaceae archaeon]